MWLIIVYLIFMIVGDIADYFIGSAVDRVWPAASLPVFLACMRRSRKPRQPIGDACIFWPA
jgi:hypothetical protein